MSSDWRCESCGKLLGRRKRGLVHIRIARGHEYLVDGDVVGTCRVCTTMNTIGRASMAQSCGANV